jgi:hypothetical protein
MPYYYNDVPGAKITSNATPSTANDCFFLKPGSTRTLWLKAIWVTGSGAALTAITGFSYRLENWTTTASSGGTAVTPTPTGSGTQAATHTCGYGTTVTSGTGGPLLKLSIGSGTTSPGNWVAPSIDECYDLPAAATQSNDIFNIAPTASLPFELSTTTWE